MLFTLIDTLSKDALCRLISGKSFTLTNTQSNYLVHHVSSQIIRQRTRYVIYSQEIFSQTIRYVIDSLTCPYSDVTRMHLSGRSTRASCSRHVSVLVKSDGVSS